VTLGINFPALNTLVMRKKSLPPLTIRTFIDHVVPNDFKSHTLKQKISSILYTPIMINSQ
ncbi:hypothetical protein, partial [Providencia huaxiensis]|uniref:hypothetical protein n=1 Tax=Providencia huaxiensis TaxID=2027290 RepID=UPI0034E522C4